MFLKNIEIAKKEAEEFLIRVGVVEIENVWQDEHDYPCSPTKASAALRRQSMELTRSLAELRK